MILKILATIVCLFYTLGEMFIALVSLFSKKEAKREFRLLLEDNVVNLILCGIILWAIWT